MLEDLKGSAAELKKRKKEAIVSSQLEWELVPIRTLSCFHAPYWTKSEWGIVIFLFTPFFALLRQVIRVITGFVIFAPWPDTLRLDEGSLQNEDRFFGTLCNLCGGAPDKGGQ